MVKPPAKGAPKRKAAPPVLKPSKRAKTVKNARAAAAAPKVKPGQAPKESNVGINGKPKRRPDQKKKVKLRDQGVIPVPRGEFDVGRRRRPAATGEPGEEDDEEEGEDESEEEMDGDDDDLMDLGDEEGLEAGFLLGMDRAALGRTTKETQRLHQLDKKKEQMPVQKRKKSRLPSPGSASTMSDFDINTDDELPSDSELDDSVVDTDPGDDDMSDDGEDDDPDDDSDDDADEDLMDAFDNLSDDMDDGADHKKRKGKKREEEADYETSGRSRWAEQLKKKEDGEQVEVGRLPIKLPSGEVRQVEGTTKIELPASKKRKAKPEPVSEEEDEEEEEDEDDQEGAAARMATTKGRFGRMGVAEIVGHEGWKNAKKLDASKEQIAALGAEILAGGELVDTISTLTRLSTFSLPTVTAPSSSTPLNVPNSIRGLALLSQLAVYKDLVPGYRIRQLTEAEDAEKVRDEVRRLREGEKGLVRTYKAYLKTLETEIRKKTHLATLSIKCYCDLLSSIPHFNFSENIMGVLVGKIGRRSWDEDSDLILATFIAVFKADLTSTYSQTLVRLIARMTKERKFQIHPDVLSCLLHLRLHTELEQMVANKKANKGKNDKRGYRDGKDKDKDDKEKRPFKSEIKKKWQTKAAKTREKELKEVERDMKEAEAEVDLEERAQVQTETLKNLFVLYFLILKNQQKTPLLPTALEGITHFGHFINIEFFRDLLAVLRRIVVEEPQPILTGAEVVEEEEEIRDAVGDSERIRTRLLGIATAFEILSGQGEALNIDLSDFINALFGLLRPLSLDTGVDDPINYTQLAKTFFGRPSRFRLLVPGRLPPKTTPLSSLPTSQILLRCLHSVFFSRHATNPPWRTAAFVKRLTECSLFFPPAFAKTILELVATLLSRDAKLEGMLDTEERTYDGTYKPELDDPQLVNPFATSLYEVLLIEGKYWEKHVKEEGKKLGLGNPNGVQGKI